MKRLAVLMVGALFVFALAIPQLHADGNHGAMDEGSGSKSSSKRFEEGSGSAVDAPGMDHGKKTGHDKGDGHGYTDHGKGSHTYDDGSNGMKKGHDKDHSKGHGKDKKTSM